MGKLRPRDGEGIGHTVGQWTRNQEALRLSFSLCGLRQVLPSLASVSPSAQEELGPRTLSPQLKLRVAQFMESPAQNMLEGLVEGGMSSYPPPRPTPQPQFCSHQRVVSSALGLVAALGVSRLHPWSLQDVWPLRTDWELRSPETGSEKPSRAPSAQNRQGHPTLVLVFVTISICSWVSSVGQPCLPHPPPSWIPFSLCLSQCPVSPTSHGSPSPLDRGARPGAHGAWNSSSSRPQSTRRGPLSALMVLARGQ